MLNTLRKLFVSDVDYLKNSIENVISSFDNVAAVYKGKVDSESSIFYFLYDGEADTELNDIVDDLEQKIVHNTDISCFLTAHPINDTAIYSRLGRPVYIRDDSKNVVKLWH